MSKPLCLVTAPVATRSGYGAHSRDICRALIKLDYSPLNYPPVMLIDQGIPNPQVPSALRALGCKLQKDLSHNKKSKHLCPY